MSDWNISDLYENAWKILKSQKTLWVFGTALSGLALSSGNSSSSNFDDKDIEKFNKFLSPGGIDSNSADQVLGVTTTSPFITDLVSAFTTIPLYIYAILVIEILLLTAVIITINIIYKAWLEAALIHGTQIALTGQKASIAQSSAKALPNIKSVAWVQIIPWLIFSLLLLSGLIIFILGITLSSGLLKALFIVGLIITIGAALYWLLMLTVTEIWAVRYASLAGNNGRASFGQGFKVAKKKFWSMLLLGLVNNILSWLIIGVVIAIIGGLILGAVFGYQFNQAFGIGLGIIGGLLLTVFLFSATLLTGMITAFKTTVWTDAFLKIQGKYEKD